MDSVKVWGPPGTGKTYSACRWIQRQVDQGADPERIAFVSFTNAACDEARRRIGAVLGLYDWELDYCATIHALCKRATGISGSDWLAEGAWLKEFGASYGYELQSTKRRDEEDLDQLVATGGEDAPLLAVWNFGRSRIITEPDAAYREFCAYDPGGAARVPYQRYLQFVREYEDAKRLEHRRDYTDLLLLAVEQEVRIPASVAVIDEAQDMTPLLWAAADTLFRHTPVRACMADDDQAIYSFQGATPELFNERPAERGVQLRQSRRLPRTIAELAAETIRQNRNRVGKELLPVTAEIVRARPGRTPGPVEDVEIEGETGRVRSLSELDLLNGESWFILTRNWAFVSDLARELEENGIPYRIQGGNHYSPWSDRGPLRSVQAIYRLSEPDTQVRMSDLLPLLEKTRAQTSTAPGAWKYGQKARMRELIEQSPEAPVTILDLPALGITEWGFDCIVRRRLDLLEGGISARDLAAYQTAQRRGTWGLTPRVTISTGHGAKGQEADNVAAVMSCTQMPLRNLDRPDRREEEIRLAYVMQTRARKRFYGIQQDRGLGFPYEIFGV